MRSLSVLSSLALLTASAVAQSCPEANTTCTSPFSSGNTNIFALFMPTSPAPLLLQGLELMSRATTSPATIKFEVHLADASQRPVLPSVAQGTIQMTGTYQMHRGMLTAPYLILPNTPYFISFDNSNMLHPICASGGTPWQYVWRPQNATTWSASTFTQAWTFRVLAAGCRLPASYATYGAGCKGTGGGTGIPLLGNTGLPQLGKSFTVDLSQARATAAAVLFLGVSDKMFGTIPLPLDLTPLGAPGCSLLLSPDIIYTVIVTSTSGTGSATFPIPNDSALTSLTLFNQYVVSDPTVNMLKVVVTNGGRMTIGP